MTVTLLISVCFRSSISNYMSDAFINYIYPITITDNHHIHFDILDPCILPGSDFQKGKAMIMRIRAKFINGHIVPLERLDIEENTELSVDIDIKPHNSDQERMKRAMSAAGGWKGVHDPETLTTNDMLDDIGGSLSHIPGEKVESESRLSFEERIEITKSSAGGWKGLHGPEELKRMLYEARKTGSRTEPTP